MKRTLAVAFFVFLICAKGFGQSATLTAEKEGSWIRYHLTHPMHEIEATSVDGFFRIVLGSDGRTIESAVAHVDVMTFDSKNSNRDSHAMEVVDALTYPDAAFESTKIEQRGDSLLVKGNLTFHGVTREINARGIARTNGNTIELTEEFEISLTAFKIERPSLLMVPVKDALQFAFKAVFVKP